MTAGCPGGTSKAMKTSRKKRSVAAPASDLLCTFRSFSFETDGDAIPYSSQKHVPAIGGRESRFYSASGGYNPCVSLSLHFYTVLRFSSFSFLHLSGLIIHISDLILHFFTTCFSSRGITPNSSASCRNISHILPASFVTWVLLPGLNFWRWATEFSPFRRQRSRHHPDNQRKCIACLPPSQRENVDGRHFAEASGQLSFLRRAASFLTGRPTGQFLKVDRPEYPCYTRRAFSGIHSLKKPSENKKTQTSYNV